MRRVIILIGGVMILAGCAHEDDVKTSHFEHDHEVAAHWPDDLADAAAKIRERLGLDVANPSPAEADPHAPHDSEEQHDHHHEDHHHEEPDTEPGDEVADIVSWVPEIAADTNLSEQDWIPLDNAAASLGANLHAANNELTKANREQAIAFCELIEQSIGKIPETLQPPQASSK